VKVLLELGARVDIEVQPSFGTPLHTAAGAALPEVVSLLLQASADPCARRANGLTPIQELEQNRRLLGQLDALRGFLPAAVQAVIPSKEGYDACIHLLEQARR